jgi:hypothetical protein
MPTADRPGATRRSCHSPPEVLPDRLQALWPGLTGAPQTSGLSCSKAHLQAQRAQRHALARGCLLMALLDRPP